ncbi:glycosyltransferase family 4 protein [Candidatus Magnetobacterium casensis]|uniref:Glycosyltransferase family 4 protein n=1 Tax=Candidatus Magnetobacterium casense TaxID=1455061 RepID=A0ABS6S203_9BACT|nr:glycosyltransferase family 4 protein [Candidatus Magnetobacterium casensis]
MLAEAHALIRRGHYACIVCREHARIREEARKKDIDTYTLPLRSNYDLVSIWKLCQFIKGQHFDVVNTHSGKDSWIGGIAARMAKTPVLVRTRHLDIRLKRNIVNFIHYLPDTYITCGLNMRDNLIKNCGFPPERVVSIPTGIDERFLDTPRQPQARTEYDLDANAVVISNVGILRTVKGQEVTLQAFKRVLEALPHARCLLVGDGPGRNRLENVAKTLGISEHVIFTGYVEDVARIYSFSDVCVLSSFSEGVPQSVLQAMAVGVPVVATRVGGVPEVVVHEETGLLVDSGDHEAIAAQILRLVNDPALVIKLTKNARTFVLKDHCLEAMVSKIEHLYMTLLQRKTGNQNEDSIYPKDL